jgi:Leucine-rich repeat (LRR) protein
VYRAALKLKPDDARAKANAELCDQLSGAPKTPDGKLTRESLSKLNAQMVKDERSAAELMPVARALGDEKKYIVNYWLERLKDLPNGTDTPLEKRLTVRDDGLLDLNLGETQIADLSPLSGMPLGTLNIPNCKKVTDLSPLRGMPLTKMSVADTGVTSLEPLRGMSSLQKLFITNTTVSDLSPLAGLRLNWLEMQTCPVTSLEPLRGMPLEQLRMEQSGVTDLSPLAGMPIKVLDVSYTGVQDFTPLKGMPLETFWVMGMRVGDLSWLKGAPLKQLLLWRSTDLRNVAALSDIRTLEVLMLPERLSDLPVEEFAAVEGLRNHPSLKRLAARVTLNLSVENIPPVDEFCKNWDRDYAWALRLRKAGIAFTCQRYDDGTWYLVCDNQPLRDLSILAGAAISHLNIHNDNEVSDLGPLKELPLKRLALSNNSIKDLGSLRGLKLQSLWLHCMQVSDLSVLRDMPLEVIDLRLCDQLKDLTPLANIRTLRTIALPIHAANLEPLRKLPNLKRLAFTWDEDTGPVCTAEEFWKTWDGLRWARKLEAAGITFGIGQMPDGFYDVTVHDPNFTDCSIFKGSNVRRLDLNQAGVTDLSPLTNLPLRGLSLGETRVTDLSPLRSPVLRDSMRELRLGRTKVVDFSPVAGCVKLEVFDASDTALANLSVVKGMKLRTLMVARTAVADVSVVAGMPLETVSLVGTKVTDLSPLLKCPTIKSLVLPQEPRDIESVHALPNLIKISYTVQSSGDPDMTADQFWASVKPAQDDAWLIALRKPNIAPKTRRLKDGSWELILDNQPIADLSMLKGARITRLSIAHPPVTDLSPLRGMKLTFLRISGTKVSDLSPIQGMPITNLTISGSNVRDLTPLVGMPLRALNMPDCKQIADLSPLAEMTTLESVILPPGAKNIEFLRKLPNLARLGYKFDGSSPNQTAEEFWAEYDRKQKAAVAATHPAANDQGAP